MQCVIDRRRANGVLYLEQMNLLYLNNPKAGCSTIKYSLWAAADQLAGKRTFRGDAHDRKAAPFVRDLFALTASARERIRSAKVFSVVRNPFTRILSAYRDKVAGRGKVWPAFRQKFGIRPDVTKKDLPFSDFLALIADEPDDTLDGHFRPQYMNLLLPFTKPHFVGHLEDAALPDAFRAITGLELRNRRGHATGSSRRLQDYYDERSIALVQEKFADDFRLFGYAPDLSAAREFDASAVEKLDDGAEDALLRWLANGEAPADVSDPAVRMADFSRADDPAAKMRLIERSYSSEYNIAYLQRYARFLSRYASDSTLLPDLYDRIEHLHSRHMKAVRNPDIFISPSAA